MSAKAKHPATLNGFITHSCTISYGIINAIVNAIIFYLLNMKHNEFTATSIFIDLAITSFILSAIVAFFAFMAVKGSARQGSPFVAPVSKQEHLLFRNFPRNKFLAGLLISIINTILVPAFFVGLPAGLNLLPLNLISATLLKGIACGTAGALTGYFAIMTAVLDQAPLKAGAGAAEAA